ncbi:MAG: response regulator [Opitutaceae bacterium]
MQPATAKPIVLVDDEKSYNDLLRGMLADHLDCPVYGFSRPREALLEIAALDPAVIVTDYFMPEMNGFEFIRHAAPLAPGANFVMISGNNLSAEQDTMDRLPNFKALLAKPFGWARLADEIMRAWPADLTRPTRRDRPPA